MIIFLYGTDNYHSWHKLEELKSAFKRKIDKTGSNIVVMEEDNFDFSSLREQVMTPALFVKERMIIIKNLLRGGPSKDLQKQIIELSDKSGDNVLVFWEDWSMVDNTKKMQSQELFKFLSKQKYVYVFNKFSGTKLESWIRQKVIEQGGKIKPEVVRLLVAVVGNDLWRLENEIRKLVSYSGDKEIDREMVKQLVVEVVDDDIWQFTDALARRDQRRSLLLLQRQLQQEVQPTELFSRIVWQFRVLLMVKEVAEQYSSSDKIATHLGLHPYVVKKALSVVNHFSPNRLRHLYKAAVDLDIELKSNKVSPELLLTMFVVEV